MSFGSSGFGGFGASNNNQNNAFGGFGANNTTTTTAGTGFGGFGTTSNNTGGSLFGNNANNTTANTGFGASSGFGSNNNQSTGFGQTRPSGFGASNTSTGGGIFGNTANNTPSTGFGGFGSNQAQNTSSPFGGASTNTGGGIFGQNNTATSTGFGNTANTSSPFGAGNTSTGFGSAGGFGTSTNNPTFGAGANAQQQNNGTAGAPFQPFVDKDGVGGQQQQYMSITCQDAYRNFSFEELRQQDYLQGRKHGNANGQGGAFGASTGFGGFGAANNTTSNTSSPFGANNTTSAFGAQPAAPAFGATPSTNTTGFGSSGGLFGQSKPAGGGLFGSNTAATSSQPSGGLFGTSSGTNSTGFGGGATGGSLFGAKPATTGFGSTSTTGFGSNNNQPATGGGLFGSSTTNTASQGLFGNTQQQNTSSPFGGGFGQNQPAQNQTQTTGGGLFGNSPFGANNNSNQAKPGGLFGASTNTNTGGGLFGSTASNNQQQQQPAAGGLFGLGNNNQTQNTGTGLFGAPKPAATNSLFGAPQPANNTGGGLFGSSQNNNSTGGLFGSTQNNNTGGGLFGNASNQQKPGGLFGNSASQTNNNNNNTGGGGLFGSSTQNNNNTQSLFGGSTLGGSQQQSQSPQALTTSIMSSTPYGNTELFASLATPQNAVGPLATPLSSSQKQRKPAPLAQWKINPAASSRLITPQKRTAGYGFSYSTYGTPGSAFGSPSLYGGLLSGGNSGRLNKSLSTSNLRSTYNGGETVLNPDAFSPSPRSFRAGGSLKKLHINRNLRSDLFGGEDASLKTSPLKKAVSFDPDNSQVSEGSPTNGESSTALARIEERDSATPSAEDLGYIRSPRKANNGPNADQSVTEASVEQVQGNELAVVHEDEPEAEKAPVEQQRPLSMFPDQTDKIPGEYWMKPTKAEIAKMSRQQRKSVKGFTVGRENTGQIQFSEVNLDGVDLDRLIGTEITIQTREAVVYPNELTKLPPGKGFNVPSLITLQNAWPRARAGAIPVYERKGKRYEKHIERLQKVVNTEFVDYDPSTGAWTFRVDHFSSYQVPDYDEDESLALSSSILSAPPDTPTPQSGSSRYPTSQRAQSLQEPSLLSNGSSMQGLDMDDTFAFRMSNRLPGAFDDDVFVDQIQDSNGFNNSNLIGGDYTADLAGPEMQTSGGSGSEGLFDNTAFNDNVTDLDSSLVREAPQHTPTFAASMKPKSILKAGQQLPYFGGTPPRIADAATGDWADQLQRTLSPKKRDRNVLRESLGTGLLHKDRLSGSLTKESNPFATSIDVMKSLFGGEEGSRKQSVDRRGFQWPYAKRSKLDPDSNQEPEDDFHQLFRPSWADDMQLRTKLKDPSEASKKWSAPEMLATQRELTKFSVSSGVPQAEMVVDFAFSRFAAAAEAQAKDTTSPDMARALNEEQIMWQVASLLFDKIEGRPEQVDVERKERVAAFWAKLVESKAQSQATESKTAEERAFALLSCRDIEGATMALSDGRDYRLSMSIAQIGADERMRAGMTQQIDHWRENNSLSEVPSRVRVLYELLAGNTTFSLGKTGAGPENKAKDIFISQDFGLDWRQSFGLKLWYGSPTDESLATTVLEHYQDLLTGDEKVQPVPWFVQDKIQTGWSRQEADATYVDQHDGHDILWSLLEIYVAQHLQTRDTVFYDSVWDGFPRMIDAGNVTGNPMNARLGFQLYQTLATRRIIDYDGDEVDRKADRHAIDYAFELASSASNLVDAVFVALHMAEAETREKGVKLLLNKHADAIGEDRASSACYRTLTDVFLLPESWLWAAKASYAKHVLNDDMIEMHCLLRAGQPKEAHETLKRKVGPMAVIEEELESLKAVLADFESFGVVKSTEWSAGGGLYYDYVALLNMPKASESVKGERLRLAKKLEKALPHVDAAGLTLEERAAVSEMAVVVAKTLKEMGEAEATTVSTRSTPQDVLAYTERLSKHFYAQVMVA